MLDAYLGRGAFWGCLGLLGFGVAASCQGSEEAFTEGCQLAGCPASLHCSASGVCQDCLDATHCPFGKQCVAGSCTDPTCAPGAKQCGVNSVLTCRPDGTGFDAVPCVAGQSCVTRGGGEVGCEGVGGAGGGGGGGTGASGGQGGQGGGGQGGEGGGDGLIDDMEDGDVTIPMLEGRVGRWSAYQDGPGELALSIEAIEGGGRDGSFQAVLSSTTSNQGTFYAVRVNVNQPEAAPDSSLPYDASRYRGVRFWARGSEGSLQVTFPTEDTDVLGGKCQDDCSNHFEVRIELGPEWRRYDVLFDDAEQDPALPETPAGFDTSKLYGVHFFLWGGPYTLWVDDPEFI